MAGTDTLTALRTGCLVSGQPCHTRADRRNVFDCLFYLGLISKVFATAVRTNTESHFNILVDVIGLLAKSTGMSMLASGALWRRDALLFWYPERGGLPVCGALGNFERLF
jgi:hypothetical protein